VHTDNTEISEARLCGGEPGRFGVCPPVVPGQDFAGLAGLVRDGAVTDLAARDRKVRNGHGKRRELDLFITSHDARTPGATQPEDGSGTRHAA
jgi:hypothetical protein